jgi:hypothetical protein
MDIIYRVTILKMNGAIWTETVHTEEEALKLVADSIDEYPHVVLSKHRKKHRV